MNPPEQPAAAPDRAANAPAPIYTEENVHPAYQLNWSLSFFPRAFVPPSVHWIEPLRNALESSGVRILECSTTARGSLQFLVSTAPHVAPAGLLREVKGRLQYLVRDVAPRAFRRNYRLESIGTVRAEVVEEYVRGQLEHHLADERPAIWRLHDLQICREDVDLSAVRYSAHGQFIYNLHLVFCREARDLKIDEEQIRNVRGMLVRICAARGFLLSKAGILPDHLHVVLGLPLDWSPMMAGLSFLNNLAFAEGMQPVYKFGFYAGTCGAYDLGAVRKGP